MDVYNIRQELAQAFGCFKSGMKLISKPFSARGASNKTHMLCTVDLYGRAAGRLELLFVRVCLTSELLKCFDQTQDTFS